ncbi:MAG: hypothetical protein IIA83_11855 [Thaumarchaeota archaeon]|nr:hypothetical protein [Nitrososphaerota archaeon]
MILIETTQDTFRGQIESGTLIYLNAENIDYIYKTDPAEDIGFIVMASGIRIKITSGMNDLFAKIKRQAQVESIL